MLSYTFFFSLYEESDPEVLPLSFETPCIHRNINYKESTQGTFILGYGEFTDLKMSKELN
jgi:hypothetical protein